MKILLISPLPPPNGGIGTWTKKYLEHCKDYGINADVVNTALTGRRGERINAKRCIKDEVSRTRRIFQGVNDRLNKDRYDIVHLNTSCDKFGLYRDYLLCRMIKRHGERLVVHFRCNLDSQINKHIRQYVFKKIVIMSDKLLTLNKDSLKFVSRFAADKAIILPNFLEEGFASRSFTVRKDVEKIVFVGHVQFTKGFREIYGAAKYFPEKEFVLIGPVKDEVKEYKLLSNLTFKGEVCHEEIMDELQMADLFLFPSYTEGFSNALVEAMAVGLPVIASDVGANKEMVEHEGGIIVPSGSIEAIIQAIKDLSDAEDRRRMSKWNQEKVKKNYTISSVLKQLSQLYDEIVR